MNPEEQTTREFLLTLNLGSPEHEPDGKIPPDFAFGKQIGIEVTRLTQVIRVDGIFQSTEDLQIPLWKSFVEVLGGFNVQYKDKTYKVGMEFDHLFHKPSKSIKKQMRVALQKFLDSNRAVPCQLNINDAIAFSVYDFHPVEGRVFIAAGSCNNDAGGAVIQMYAENIRYCVQKKVLKVEPVSDRYKEWWLFLVDFMDWGLTQDEVNELRELLDDLGCFNRLCVINREKRLLLDVKA